MNMKWVACDHKITYNDDGQGGNLRSYSFMFRRRYLNYHRVLLFPFLVNICPKFIFIAKSKMSKVARSNFNFREVSETSWRLEWTIRLRTMYLIQHWTLRSMHSFLPAVSFCHSWYQDFSNSITNGRNEVKKGIRGSIKDQRDFCVGGYGFRQGKSWETGRGN